MELKDNKIQKYYTSLRMMDITTEQYPLVKQDMYNLKQILDYLSGEQKTVNFSKEAIASADYDKGLEVWFKDNFDNIVDYLLSLSTIKPARPAFTYPQKISPNDISKLTYYFFNSTSKELRDFLFYSNALYKLHISNHRNSKCSVQTVYINYFQEHFTLLNGNTHLESAMLLAGELAQLYAFDYNVDLEKRNEISLFKDTIKKAYELMFLDYYKNNEFSKEALALECKISNKYISNVRTLIDKIENNSDIGDMKELMQNVFSNSLAITLRNLFYQDRLAFNELCEQLKDHVGKADFDLATNKILRNFSNGTSRTRNENGE